MVKSTDREQHMLVNTAEYKHLLDSIDFSRFHVVELGVGTGVVTRLILSRNPIDVVGYEIDAGLCRISDPRFVLRVQDFTQEDFSYMRTDAYGVIANPPYQHVPFIQEQILERYGIEDVIQMIPPRQLWLFPGYTVEFELSGKDFVPESAGRHLVIRRGFSC